MEKYVFSFEEGNKEMKSLLGGKGANLAEMNKIGLPVPPGFTITTRACNMYFKNGEKVSEELRKEIFTHLNKLEKALGKKFGDNENPLLVSVRSGAVISMPGMMDTVLNLGLNDKTVEGLAKQTSNSRLANDSYRRFIQMFGDVVLNIPKYEFDRILEKYKIKYNVKNDTELTTEQLREMIIEYKKVIKKKAYIDFPQKPEEQLSMAVNAVFKSWQNQRAIIYRNLNGIPHDLGTAVNVQSMVFGNMGDTSGTGVAFTRNPATGEKDVFGEFLINAQGEDVVAGIRTPKPISKLQEIMPEIYNQFIEIADKLEKHYKDMQDIEFTIEREKLYILQTRTGKRTAVSATKAAVDMTEEGLIDKETAIMRINPDQIDQLLHPTFEESELEKAEKMAKGLPASPGAATGKVYFTSEEVVKAAKKGEKVILVRTETSPEDIEGMVMAEGILTSRGGMTSHAAVVARGMGKCCVSGCSEIRVEEGNKQFKIGACTIREGEYISLDGNKGNVYLGTVKTKAAELSGSYGKLMKWADEFRKLKIRTNADTPKDARAAVRFGAEGIGLCRTEHMFFNENRIFAVRQMIIADNKKDRIKALEKLFPYQRDDFIEIFKEMKGRPINVRLLDPPLHEFLPHKDEDIRNLTKELNISFKDLKNKIEDLKEFNPMLGHRGCRLGISYPEIYEMQVKALITAVIEVKKKNDIEVKPEIMIPLIGHENELKILRDLVCDTAEKLIKESGIKINYKVGTMIEVPRAALIADRIAKHADFFSFGTNDLTQMTLGFSRDDSGKFINVYREKEVFEKDPFEVIDQDGVGSLMKLGIKLGRQIKENLKIGICGEHGGEPNSIDFCHRIGLDYVSCSPYRVPIARLAAAQAAIKNK